MSRLDDRYDFDWLPGFREMMACQEKESEMTERNRMEGDTMDGAAEPQTDIGAPAREMAQPDAGVLTGEMAQPDTGAFAGRAVPSDGRTFSEGAAQPQMLPPEELQQEEQINWNDFEYMIRMLPAAAREVWAVADALLDRFEFEGSSMYAEYPDKNAVLKIVDAIYEKLKYYESEQTENKVDGTRGKNCYYLPPEERGVQTPFRHLILVIVCWNMAYRRQRYRRRKKIFPLS